MAIIRFMELGLNGKELSNEEANRILDWYVFKYQQSHKGERMSETKTYKNHEEAGLELDRRVRAIMFDDPKLKYKEAMRRVLDKDAELKRAYAQT